MKKLAILLVLLAICLPSYSEILVYQTIFRVNPGASRDLDDPNVGWETITGNSKAWMVIDVNLADLADPAIDVNLADPNQFQGALIPFGVGIDPNGTPRKKVYVNDAFLEVFAFSILPGLQLTPVRAKPDIFIIDFFADNVAPQIIGVGVVDARMQGPATRIKTQYTLPDPNDRFSNTDVVARSLRGVGVYDSIFDDTLAGSGMIQSTLNNLWTMRANEPFDANDPPARQGFDGVFADVVAAIKAQLEAQKYVAVDQSSL